MPNDIRETMGQILGVASTSGGRGEIVYGSSPFDALPEDCISTVISFTTPRDACVAATVSKTFRSAVQSDIVWEKFLPADYQSLIPPSRVFSSKKEVYFALCDPVLIDSGRKSFWFDKATGKTCIMLSPRQLQITWGDTPQYWSWISIPEARFVQVPELLNVCWFEIHGRMNTRILSPGTRYSAYIVFKTVDECPGLGELPVEVGVGLVGQQTPKRFIYFVGSTDGLYQRRGRRRDRERTDVKKPDAREDGWMEAELGEFCNEDADDIQFSVEEIRSPYWKRGLIIQGIEFRPTKTG